MQTTQKRNKMHSAIQYPKKHRTGSPGKTKECTHTSTSDAFLRNRFLPMVKGKACLKNWRAKEADLFSSYHSFCTAKGIPPKDFSNIVYPYNVHLAYKHAKENLSENDDDDIIIVSDQIHECRLITISVFCTGRTLYYIPCRPLWRLKNDKRKRKQYNLLLSVFAYLLEIAHLPSYKRGDMVDCYYEMIQEKVMYNQGDWEEQHIDEIFSELREAAYFGHKLHKQMEHPFQLDQWNTRINNFVAYDSIDTEILMLATHAYKLYCTYPNRRFYDNIFPGLLYPEEEDRTRPDQYISFVWSANGSLSEQLEQYVNMYIQENGITDEPLYIRHYDNKEEHLLDTLDFEKSFFKLLENLCATLNLIDEK